jgi:hypothetical protein
MIAPGRLRITQVWDLAHGWVSCSLSQLEPGDRFRMLEPDLTPVRDESGLCEWVVQARPYVVASSVPTGERQELGFASQTCQHRWVDGRDTRPGGPDFCAKCGIDQPSDASPAAVDPKMNPWHPMTNPVDLKTLGKFIEELGENVSAAARCLIQGIDEDEPVTRKPNRQWITEEIADVLANVELTIERFNLDRESIDTRKAKKRAQLKSWHDMA